MRLVFAGTPEFARHALTALSQAGHDIVLVLTQPDRPAGRGMKLKEGIVLAIEPMVNLGGSATKTLADGWTHVTSDGSPSAHFEHTVLTTERGPEILTVPRPAQVSA